MHDSSLDPTLIAAFHETHYRVDGPEPFVLRIGQPSPELARAHSTLSVSSSTFVTACNPHSRSLSEEENQSRMELLRNELIRQGKICWSGVGHHPSNGWPGEPSVLVFGMSRCESLVLAARLEQNATVWCGADAVPELLLLR